VKTRRGVTAKRSFSVMMTSMQTIRFEWEGSRMFQIFFSEFDHDGKVGVHCGGCPLGDK
jgi:hypothetical protein